MPTPACPCGLGQPYDECCGPAHAGEPPATAEALMRSRYSAFARGYAAYLLASWHPKNRPSEIELDPGLRWVGLQVLGGTGGGLFDRTGEVEFVAYFQDGRKPGELHEVSQFVRHDGQWVYWGPAL